MGRHTSEKSLYAKVHHKLSDRRTEDGGTASAQGGRVAAMNQEPPETNQGKGQTKKNKGQRPRATELLQKHQRPITT